MSLSQKEKIAKFFPGVFVGDSQIISEIKDVAEVFNFVGSLR